MWQDQFLANKRMKLFNLAFDKGLKMTYLGMTKEELLERGKQARLRGNEELAKELFFKADEKNKIINSQIDVVSE